MEIENTHGLHVWSIQRDVWDQKQGEHSFDRKDFTISGICSNERVFQVRKAVNADSSKTNAEKNAKREHKEEDHQEFKGNQGLIDWTEEEKRKAELT